jgi:thymidylate synthase
MQNYQQLLSKILLEGEVREDRTGTGTVSLFGEQLKFNLNEGFPAVTTKKLAWRAVVSELLWFLEGSSDERRLAEILHGTRDNSKNTIWTANANADYWKPNARYEGDLGRVYGVQWRFWRKAKNSWQTVDQVRNLINDLKTNPYSRRHILTAWNPGELDQMALPPCHMFAQFYVSNDNKLSCLMHQRSCDMFLGVPFNIASYSLLTHILAQECNLGIGDFIWSGGDCHIYTNHVDAVKQQLIRAPRALPVLSIREDRKIGEYEVDDFTLIGYDPHDSIKAEMAI